MSDMRLNKQHFKFNPLTNVFQKFKHDLVSLYIHTYLSRSACSLFKLPKYLETCHVIVSKTINGKEIKARSFSNNCLVS